MEIGFSELIYGILVIDLKKTIVKKNNIITEWLNQHGDPEIDRFVQENLEKTIKIDMKTKVYSAFPGVGKTIYFNTTDKTVLDSDSSKFDKKHFPDNYIDHIERNIQDPKVDKILVSSHKDVRDALVKKGIPFVLVYPHRELKDEYIQRYKERGNNDAFVDLLEKNWDNWMDEMDAMNPQEGQSLYKIKLGPGQYLTDVID